MEKKKKKSNQQTRGKVPMGGSQTLSGSYNEG